jgi:hypothetical protein
MEARFLDSYEVVDRLISEDQEPENDQRTRVQGRRGPAR